MGFFSLQLRIHDLVNLELKFLTKHKKAGRGNWADNEVMELDLVFLEIPQVTIRLK